jgi:4,5-DOPA dioxygenase extradiol
MSEFVAWVRGAVAAGDHEALIDYAQRAPHGKRNHPMDEHFLPLFVALGAAGPGARITAELSGESDRAIALDSYVLSADQASDGMRQEATRAAKAAA